MGPGIPEPLGEKAMTFISIVLNYKKEKNTIHIVATDAAGNTSNLTVNLEVK